MLHFHKTYKGEHIKSTTITYLESLVEQITRTYKGDRKSPKANICPANG